jgi:hypothetical protein
MTTLHSLPTVPFVAAAFAELLEDVTNLLAAAQQQKPCDKEETGFWRRQLSALNKAEAYWLQGVRPHISAESYLLTSASRPGALVHRLSKQGGIVVCSCEAGQRALLCWHHMLINVVERAAELESAAQKEEEIGGGGSESAPETAASPIPHAAAAAAWLTLQTRLAVTAQYVATLRAAQRCDPPGDNPLGDDQGDDLPARRLGLRLVQARRTSAYFTSALYLAA